MMALCRRGHSDDGTETVWRMERHQSVVATGWSLIDGRHWMASSVLVSCWNQTWLQRF